MSFGESSNGFILSLIHFAAKEFSWPLQQILDENLLVLILLSRQAVYSETGGKGGITLLQQEELEEKMNSMSWEEIVKKNREEMMKRFKM